MRSSIYEGTVTHHRFAPIDHRFSYRIALPFVDLEALEQLCRAHPLWALDQPNIVSFRRRDYLPNRPGSLTDAVRDAVEEHLGVRPAGPVAMLAHPRTWGWLFNPIALYYCLEQGAGRVEALVIEVTNTPWHERHVYVVGPPGRHLLAKELHVSPFMGMDMHYTLTYGEPNDHLSLSMRATRDDEVVFDAGMHLRRRDVDRRAMGRLIWGHPLMTMRVSGGIYRQALALWRAGTPFVPHPRRQTRMARSTRKGTPRTGPITSTQDFVVSRVRPDRRPSEEQEPR